MMAMMMAAVVDPDEPSPALDRSGRSGLVGARVAGGVVGGSADGGAGGMTRAVVRLVGARDGGWATAVGIHDGGMLAAGAADGTADGADVAGVTDVLAAGAADGTTDDADGAGVTGDRLGAWVGGGGVGCVHTQTMSDNPVLSQPRYRSE